MVNGDRRPSNRRWQLNNGWWRFEHMPGSACVESSGDACDASLAGSRRAGPIGPALKLRLVSVGGRI